MYRLTAIQVKMTFLFLVLKQTLEDLYFLEDAVDILSLFFFLYTNKNYIYICFYFIYIHIYMYVCMYHKKILKGRE